MLCAKCAMDRRRRVNAGSASSTKVASSKLPEANSAKKQLAGKPDIKPAIKPKVASASKATPSAVDQLAGLFGNEDSINLSITNKALM